MFRLSLVLKLCDLGLESSPLQALGARLCALAIHKIRAAPCALVHLGHGLEANTLGSLALRRDGCVSKYWSIMLVEVSGRNSQKRFLKEHAQLSHPFTFSSPLLSSCLDVAVRLKPQRVTRRHRDQDGGHTLLVQEEDAKGPVCKCALYGHP